MNSKFKVELRRILYRDLRVLVATSLSKNLHENVTCFLANLEVPESYVVRRDRLLHI
jgi:hypothetical protein